MAYCRSCERPIVWVVSDRSGKAMPLDPEPAPFGNIRLVHRVDAPALARVLNLAELVRADETDELLYLSHFATCPNAHAHRRPAAPAQLQAVA